MSRVKHIQRHVHGVFYSPWASEGDCRLMIDFREGDSLVLSSKLLSVVMSHLGENLANWGGQTLEISISAPDVPNAEQCF